jgi:hypothetical protein
MELAFWKLKRWRAVIDYEGLYEVDWLCNVRSLNYKGTGLTNIKTPYLTKYGYLQVRLFKDGKGKGFFSHRLGLLAWVANPEKKRCVNHKTHIRTKNNVFTQLEWATHKENTKDAQEFGSHFIPALRGEKHGNAKFSDATIDKVFELRALGYLHREIGADLSMSKAHVSKILLGKIRKRQ